MLQFLILAGTLFAADDIVTTGFDHFYNLEFDQSVNSFQQAIEKNPNVPDLYNHLAQAILYREMLRTGALESELVTGNNPFLRREKMKPSAEDQTRFEKSIAKAMELAQAALAKSPNDVSALYSLGVTYGLRGNYNFLVKKAWSDALKDVTQSRKMHNKVTDLQPGDYDARLVQGVHDYIVGSLPFAYKMLGFVVGFRGDKEGGLKTLQLVAEKGDKNKGDAKVILAVAYRRERRPVDAIPLLKDLLVLYPRNYLFRLEMVQMYADLGDKQKALDTLQELDKIKASNTPGFAALPDERIHFARGNLLFWYRDYDIAIEELRKATDKTKDLDLNTGSMAWLRLGQCLDMKQKRNEAVKAYRQAIEVAPDSDAARQCKQFLSAPYRRGKT